MNSGMGNTNQTHITIITMERMSSPIMMKKESSIVVYRGFIHQILRISLLMSIHE